MRFKYTARRLNIHTTAALALAALAVGFSVPATASTPVRLPVDPSAQTSPDQAGATTSIHRIRGFLPDLRFSLEGAQGNTVTEKALEGKVVLLFFGYASCPDICPTTMAQLSQVVENLGAQADKVQIVFISVDPHRDTPEILHAYVSAFNDHAIGLTGSERQVADVARRYRVAYQIEAPTSNDPDNYEVTHARGIYIFDQKGRARFLASDSESIDSLTASVQELLG
ncbi:MAG TPA: SCO family protein [Pusillimonas sp.]|uniref:SCO family protein n=1 Tax=Pusillimonas sp. TaxID=3040095 RepID=UPI002BF436F5|nr:SCO family protein [Pusillimonas sp.]HUH87209.1 SCO family protein [Pusillimonas sp.]